MLKIRLRRIGKKHQPIYRVVVVEHTAPVQGSYLEALGQFDPRAATFTVSADRVKHWLDNGAQPSERIAKLLTASGMKHAQIVLPDYDKKPKRVSKKAPVEVAAPKAEAPATETAAEESAVTEEVVAPAEEAAPVEETPVVEEPAVEAEKTEETPAEPAETQEEGSNSEEPAAE